MCGWVRCDGRGPRGSRLDCGLRGGEQGIEELSYVLRRLRVAPDLGKMRKHGPNHLLDGQSELHHEIADRVDRAQALGRHGENLTLAVPPDERRTPARVQIEVAAHQAVQMLGTTQRSAFLGRHGGETASHPQRDIIVGGGPPLEVRRKNALRALLKQGIDRVRARRGIGA